MNVGEGENVCGLLTPAVGDQASSLVSFHVEVGDLRGHAEHGCVNGNGHLALEHVEERRELLVGVDGGLVNELARECATTRRLGRVAWCDYGSRKIR